MSAKYNDRFHEATKSIDDEINAMKDLEYDLELRRSKKEITRDRYYAEIKLIRQKEEKLLSEKKDLLEKVT